MTQSELLELARMLRKLARTAPTPAIRGALLQIADRYAAAVVTGIGNAGSPIDQRYKRARYFRLMAALAVTPQTKVELNRLADWYAKLAGPDGRLPPARSNDGWQGVVSPTTT